MDHRKQYHICRDVQLHDPGRNRTTSNNYIACLPSGNRINLFGDRDRIRCMSTDCHHLHRSSALYVSVSTVATLPCWCSQFWNTGRRRSSGLLTSWLSLIFWTPRQKIEAEKRLHQIAGRSRDFIEFHMEIGAHCHCCA